MIAVSNASLAFELGFALPVAGMLSLGPRNTLVLRQGVSRRHVMMVAGTCFGCDVGLIAIAILGFGATAGAIPSGLTALRALGACYLMMMSARLFVQASRRCGARPPGKRSGTQRIFVAALMVSLLNPLVWIETVFVIGAVSTTVNVNLLLVFALGAALGSFCKFSLLGSGAQMLAPLFCRPTFCRAFDALTGLVMTGMAVMLIRGLAS